MVGITSREGESKPFIKLGSLMAIFNVKYDSCNAFHFHTADYTTSIARCILDLSNKEYVMKKIIIALAVLLAGTAVFLATTGKDKAASTTPKSSAETKSTASAGKKACELFTLADAKALIGDNAVLVEGSGSDNLATTEPVNVDNCTYSSDGATLGDLTQITIQRHYGDKAQVVRAYESYKKEFPGDDVASLGDKAYYVTGSEQIQVLKGNYWIHSAGGSINAGDEANKEMVTKAAKVVLQKL